MVSGKKLGLYIDDISTLNVNKDSSCRLAAEAEARGYDVFYFAPKGLFFEADTVYANGYDISFKRREGVNNSYKFGKHHCQNLHDLDVLLIRKDPPYALEDVTATYLLGLLSDDVLMVNHPKSIRSAHSKLQTLLFKEFIPETIIARNDATILSFINTHKTVVLKPVDGMGGRGVSKLTHDDPNLKSLIETTRKAHGDYVIVQEYIEDAVEGEKRIFIFDGKPMAAIKKVPKKGDFRANITAGAGYERAELTAHDRKICDALSDYILKQKLFFVGLDIIGDKLIEINATSPGAISWANTVHDIPLETVFFDVLDKKLGHKA